MPTTWTISVDWDRNGDFSSTDDNITTFVEEATWFLGFRKPYMEMADNATCTLTLSNTDKRFSPENSSSPLFGKLKPLRPVRIQSFDGTTTRTHFTGWIETINPLPGMYAERKTAILAVGAMQFLMGAETKLALQQNQRSDEIIDLLLKEVIIPPALTRAFFLDVPGSAELGESTYLGDSEAYKVFDTGITTFTLTGDQWVNDGGYTDKPKDTFDVYRAIRDIVAAERGKFFFDREGQAVFWNRHHLLQTATSAVTLNDDMNGLNYQFGGTERLKNEIIVVCHPRSFSASATDVLWELPADNTIRVDAGKTREVYIKYEDENRQRVGALDVTLSDLVVEGTVTASVEAKANGANLVFLNNSDSAAFVTSAKVRGRKILDQGAMEAEKEDGLSIANHGRRTLRINLPALMSLDEATQIATFEQQRRSTPVGEVQSVTLQSQAVRGGGSHAQQLSRTVGDRVTITETQTAHSAEYWIVGEAHEIQPNGALYQTQWYLESVPTATYFKLGTSEVGGSHVLAY